MRELAALAMRYDEDSVGANKAQFKVVQAKIAKARKRLDAMNLHDAGVYRDDVSACAPLPRPQSTAYYLRGVCRCSLTSVYRDGFLRIALIAFQSENHRRSSFYVVAVMAS